MRLQLTPVFDFVAAARRLDTIAELGVSHVYLSPITEAVPGSRHGYDVTDHTEVRADFGGDEGLEALLDAAAQRSLGVIIDHVPNHVSVEHAHLHDHWWATLRDGPSSPSAAWFDIDWRSADDRVIIPKLGAPLAEMIAAGDITSAVGDLGPELRVGTLRFPLAAGTHDLDVADAVEQQHYALRFWREPERNVRRFFTIDDLVAVRVEDRDVAHVVDAIPRRLVDHPAFAGVRVDHVDGLAAPGEYLHGLRDLLGDRLLVVEKIVAPGEQLPNHWPVDGTTGYEQIAAAEHALLDPAAEGPLMRVWRESTDDRSFVQLERAARAEVLAAGLAPDFDRLARQVVEIDAGAPTPLGTVRAAIDELTLAIERYRTYLPDDDASTEVFNEVVAHAANRRDTVADIARVIRTDTDALRRWQQLTGPAVAKGGEDRAFYRWFPLASLCEVGGDPSRFGTPVSEFHEVQRRRQVTHPSAMLAENTHDTKRSAGVRSRSLALAAHADEWAALVTEWLTDHAGLVEAVSGGADAALVHLALQTAATARPIDVDRLGDYLVKAAREADLITSWTDPDHRVENGLRDLAAQAIADTTTGPLAGLAGRITRDGDAAGLGLLTMLLTCPGFADMYQGSPRRLLTLVDPDNRSEVDWDEVARLVAQADTVDPKHAGISGDIDLARTVLTQRILRLRARRFEAFGMAAGYLELGVSGSGSDDVIAYARTDGDEPLVVVIVTRTLAVRPSFADTEVDLPDGTWRSVTCDDAPTLNGGQNDLAALLDRASDADELLRFEVLERIDR